MGGAASWAHMSEPTATIGTEDLQGAVTTPAEAAAINVFRKRIEQRKEAFRPKLAGMVEAIDDYLAALEAGARVTIQACGDVSDAGLDRILTVQGALDFLRMTGPHRKAIRKLIDGAKR